MKNRSWTNQCNITAGALVVGKWHKQRYTIIKKLGSGANGIVYLAKGKSGYSALKMSDDSMSIISEVNVLKAFAKVQGQVLGPSLLDVDDWERGSRQTIPFYVMEYIQGPDLLTFVQKKGQSWAGVLIVQLLEVLERMHRQGWIFGDLKPENLIVSYPPAKIRCIDVGGTTREGRSIKEFTEFFDRGYWELGSRKAEPSYDIFSAAMLLINLYEPARFTKMDHGPDQLKKRIKQNPHLAVYEGILHKAFEGRYRKAEEMKKDLLSILTLRQGRIQNHSRVKQRQGKRAKRGSVRETAGVLFVTSFLYGLYIYFYLL